jgi:hypothetical protein
LIACAVRIPRYASTCVVVDAIGARGAVQTLPRRTFINVGRAVRIRPARSTRARVQQHAISACRAVLTLARGAVVDVGARLASIGCLVPREAVTSVGARSSVHAGGVNLVAVVLPTCAWIELDSAVRAVPASSAVTTVCIDEVYARGAVLARAGHTFVDIDGAVLVAVRVGPSGNAGASVGVNAIGTRSTVQAGARGTFVDVDSAVLVADTAGPARSACACISSY